MAALPAVLVAFVLASWCVTLKPVVLPGASPSLTTAATVTPSPRRLARMGTTYAGGAAFIAFMPIVQQKSGSPSTFGMAMTVVFWMLLLSGVRIWQIARSAVLSVSPDVIRFESNRFFRPGARSSREVRTVDVQAAQFGFNFVELKPNPEREGPGPTNGRRRGSTLFAVPLVGFDRQEVCSALRNGGVVVA